MLNCEWNTSMILNSIKIYLHNVCKNNFLINTILKTQYSFNVIFIQKPSWSILRTILISTNCEGDKLVGVPNYPNWVTFSRSYTQPNDFPRVITYVNIYLSSLRFSLRNNILQHRDILCISFFNQGSIYFLINVYSDLS